MVANYLFDYFELNNRKNLIRPRLLIVGYELVKTFQNWQILPYELLMFTTKKRAVIIKKSRLFCIRIGIKFFYKSFVRLWSWYVFRIRILA